MIEWTHWRREQGTAQRGDDWYVFDAATGLIDVGRLSGFLQRIRGRIRHIPLTRVSPLAVPVMLEIGRESVPGDASEALLREAVEELIAEAMGRHAALES